MSKKLYLIWGKSMKKFISLVILFLVSVGIVFAQAEPEILKSRLGLVKHIKYVDTMENNIEQVKQIASVEILDGEFKGELIDIDNMITGNPYYDIKLKKGSKVILHVENSGGDYIFSIQDIQRSNILIVLSLIFCMLLVYVGKKKGLCSLVSIILTCGLIYYVLSPMILFGINPIFGTILISLISTTITMYLVGGFNRKSTSAILGCTLSLCFATILSVLTVKLASLTGFSNEHSIFLFTAHPELSFISIAVATIILATLGAVMDVAMSIASTINEIYSVDCTKTIKELFVCGMNVGRDIIGTMANTLILVYLGSSLPLLLLASNIDFMKFINLNQVVTEIASALIGSCGIVICVPITALVASNLVKNAKEKFDFSKINDS